MQLTLNHQYRAENARTEVAKCMKTAAKRVKLRKLSVSSGHPESVLLDLVSVKSFLVFE